MRRIVLSFALLVLAIPAWAADYFLESDGTGDFPTIQAAIDAAQSGDTIWLNSGTYSGTGNRDLYMYQDVNIKSANPAEPTVISCRGSSLFPHNAITLETCSPTLYGLTFEGGYGTDGGAVILIEASPTFSYCRFKDNDASGDGGAVFIGSDSTPLFEYTVFDHNTAGSEGGAFYATTYAEVTVNQCTFIRNKAGNGSSVFLVEDATCSIDRSILCFGQGGAACSDYYGGGYSVTCTNVAMNYGGDWVLSIAGMNGVGGNISADPQLCDPMAETPLYGPSMNSLSAVAGCGWQGAVAPDFTWENPVYGVLTDDQGMFPTIQAAIDGVVPGGVIALEDGIYTGTGNRDLIGQGNLFTLAARGSNPAACILDCQGLPGDPHRVIRFVNDDPSGTVIRGLTLTGGNMPTGSGGAVLIQNGSSPRFEDCIFRDNTVGADGGGAMAVLGASGNYSTTEIYGCTFENNFSAGDGGAIRAEYWRHLIQASDFLGNQAIQYGGDIYTENYLAGGMSNCTFLNGESVDGHSVYMKDGLDPSLILFCDFTTPISTGKGSLYVVNPDSLLLTGCEFTGNDGESGSSIFAQGVDADDYLGIDDCLFTDNGISDPAYGTVVVDSMTVDIRDSQFSGNKSVYGAALRISFSEVLLDNCSFSNNVSDYGGASYFWDGTLTATGCVFTANSAIQGGAFKCSWTEASFVDCEFEENIGRNNGGAVWASEAILDFTRVVFANNWAYSRPAMLLQHRTEARMENCTFFGHSYDPEIGQPDAQIWLVYQSHVDLNRCLITHGNTYPVRASDSSSTATAINCDIHGNHFDGMAANYVGLLEGQLGVNGNISEYPLYCASGDGDLTLNEASICLAANNSNSVDIGARGVGCYGVTPVEDGTPSVPVMLVGNHPNPFNPRTEILFTLGNPDVVRLEIYDVGGRLIRTLVDGSMMSAGPHEVVWEGMDRQGLPAPSGIYFYRLETGSFAGTGTMALLK